MSSQKVFWGCLGVIALVPISVIMNGFALCLLWQWFVVPTFDVQAIGIPAAIGIAMLMGMLTHQDMSDFQKKDQDTQSLWTSAVVRGVFSPVLTIILGYFIHSFM